MVARIAFYSSFFLFLLINIVAGGRTSLQYEQPQVSDGRDDNEAFFLNLKLKESTSDEEICEQMYGFLPCSRNVAGHLFLIVVYEYLLYHGESYAGGDGRIFGVLGNNFFGASVFQLLDSLPDSLILLGSGVVTDAETSYHAKVMFFSLIPFLVILLPSVFGLSYSSQKYKTAVLVSLFAAVICLFAYFYYQIFDDRIQNRRLEYAEVERKVELHVPFYEVQALMLDREKHLLIRQKDMEKTLKYPETNEGDRTMMTREEFYETFEEWLDVTRQLIDDPYSLDKSGTEYNQVAKLLLEDKNKLIEHISLMMERASGQKLLKEDGARDESAIDRFFERIDSNHDGFITQSELKNFIMEVNYEEIVLMEDEIANIIIRHLDIDGNGDIDKHEFKSGVMRWLKEIDHLASQKQKLQSNRETDRYQRAEAKAKAAEKLTAITLLIVGIFMLTVLAEPLVESVRKFSESVRIKTFYVSFILVPLATNARTAIAAIRAASQKRHQTTSLTFSEIYHKVFMNNILGFIVLVSVIYFRGLTWHFSAEILVVIIVCIIMGLLASSRSKFPNWTLLIAFPLYPLSLVVVYFVDDTFRYP